MTEWREAMLGDVCELKRGYDLPRQKRRSGDVPIVSSSGITGYHDEAKVKGPGVVTGRYGTLGEVFLVESDFWPLNTALYVRDFKGNDPRFVAALLTSLKLGINDAAAAVPGVNRNQLHLLPVRLPPTRAQARVSGVLRALDDLIEIDRRRVESLEQMTQAIYREWFVHFRYPGHEDVPLVDSPLGPFPEGWRCRDLRQVIELHYGKALKKGARRGGSVAVLGSSGLVGWHDEKLIDGPSIIVGRKGNVGSVIWVDGPSWPIDTTYYVITDFPLRYVVEQLRRTEFLNTHAAVPGLSREQAYSRPFLQPPQEIIASFSELSEALASQATALAIQAERLATIRDLLLPKLVTGRIDVSQLDLDALVEPVA